MVYKKSQSKWVRYRKTIMIKFIDFKREYDFLKKDIDRAVKAVMRRGQFILGPEVLEFEKQFARYCGIKYCVGVNSGTDALYLSMLCAGIGKGDEVIVPVSTFVASASAVLMAGAKPVFVDCDKNFLIDKDKIESSISARTKAIMAVHLYGRACDMTKLGKIAGKYKLILIEDCAQATGAKWNGKRVGSFGDFGCFSFYPTKNLGGYGDGGAITIKKKEWHKKLQSLRFYGQVGLKVDKFGVNSRLDEIQAAILKLKLSYLNKRVKQRREIALKYHKLIKNPNVILPEMGQGENHSFALFVIRTKQRNRLRAYLLKNGVETMVHYYTPLSKQPLFKTNSSKSFPEAEKICDEVISLPMHPFLKTSEVEKIASLINRFKN